MAGQRSDGLDPDALLPLFAENQFIHLLPDADFEASKAFRKGTQASEVIDYIAAKFGPNR